MFKGKEYICTAIHTTVFEESLPHAAAEEVIRIKEMYRGCLSWGDIHKAYDGKIRYIDHIKENGLNVWCDDYDPHKE